MAFLRAVTAFCAVLAILCSRSTLAQDNLLERGRYLVETVAFCGVCHNSRGPNGQMIPGMELAGGRVMSMNEMRTVLSNIPPGDIRAVVPNITPDPETGIGRWTDAQDRHRDPWRSATKRHDHRPADADRALPWHL